MLSPPASASCLVDSKPPLPDADNSSSSSNNTGTVPSASASASTTMHPVSNSHHVPLKSALRSPPPSSAIDKSFQGLAVHVHDDDHHDGSLTSPRPTTASSSFSNRRPSSSSGRYVPRVSFNNTPSNGGGGGTGIEQSYTLRASTSGFSRTRESRTFLVATDMNEYSMHALNWCIDSLVEDGDDLVVIRVFDPASSSTSFTKSSIADLAKEEANTLLRIVTERNCPPPTHPPSSLPHSDGDGDGIGKEDVVGPINEIGITIEHVVGKVQDSIQKMIKVYRPDSLIVGTRGRSDSLIKSAFIGSVSRYCVGHSPIPVIVVRPMKKVRKSVDKRGNRQTYLELVEGKGRPGTAS